MTQAPVQSLLLMIVADDSCLLMLWNAPDAIRLLLSDDAISGYISTLSPPPSVDPLSVFRRHQSGYHHLMGCPCRYHPAYLDYPDSP